MDPEVCPGFAGWIHLEEAEELSLQQQRPLLLLLLLVLLLLLRVLLCRGSRIHTSGGRHPRPHTKSCSGRSRQLRWLTRMAGVVRDRLPRQDTVAHPALRWQGNTFPDITDGRRKRSSATVLRSCAGRWEILRSRLGVVGITATAS